MSALDRKKLGAAFLAAREKRALSLRQVEERTGVSRSTIGRAERGHADGYVTADAVVILGAFYQIDPRDFVCLFHGNTPSGQTLMEPAG
ncbi:helix-turn-helix domain-containing protein [Roseibium alexandrii]|uniref:Helix-turn-helix protein n=1 Tax=Roseibium alexandrii (strain DSM 17067 / NCIMB 14079 / DFL-11) TaxID=244592 RepID=A0A5E8GZQ5_ROSAD|nr:helix-turn-helix transcriptional regulator [Roseibium alexandrii]EEE45437.1 helix-turn-helix protein [Roseibium alexandrii DFL-11]